MNILLNDVEVRVLGALVEKEITTPEYYPLSLTALVNACNQKLNRNPVVNYDAQRVNEALGSLREKGLARMMMGGDSRVPKYRHYFDEYFSLDRPQTAVLCELMLRGPQTPGELRGRTERFGVSLAMLEVEAILNRLSARPAGALVAALPRQPGRKETRYAHLLSGEPVVPEEEPAPTAPRDRLGQVEADVARLREEVAALRGQLEAFIEQFK